MDLRVKAILGMVGTMGLGIGLWAAITPNEEQLKKMAKELPSSNPRVQAQMRERNIAVLAMIKEAAETNENVAQRPWPWKK
ncbi:ubiquinol-cytochrome-c reductase complex assembly factor 3 [Paroedura picta]|uniref:ubiquinol-cytochrome-c reductase complex assembly factor 3 n=1 Tax=Paroedura picta TaxID=143630 RepID=UPI004055CF2E